MKIAVITTNESGKRIGEYLVSRISEAELHHNGEKGGLADLTARLFREYGGLVFIMASGIAVRMIAPHVQSKYSDPAVVVVDNGCRHAISLLSGHEGGANRLAFRVAAVLSARPVITTATEAKKRFTLGIGCRRGVSAGEVKAAVLEFLSSDSGEECSGVPALKEIRAAATVDVKRDEEGLLQAMDELDLPLLFFSAEEINSCCGNFNETEASKRQLGVRAVAEPCALLAGRAARLIIEKRILGKVTLALAEDSPGVPELAVTEPLEAPDFRKRESRGQSQSRKKCREKGEAE